MLSREGEFFRRSPNGKSNTSAAYQLRLTGGSNREMTCTYCGCRNGEGEHRCRRCGRRPEDSLSAESSLRTDGALATAPERVAVAEARQTRLSPNMSRALQR